MISMKIKSMKMITTVVMLIPSGPSGPSELGGAATTCPGGLDAQRTVPGLLVVYHRWKTGGFIMIYPLCQG